MDNKTTVRRLYDAINEGALERIEPLFTDGGRAFRDSVERLGNAFAGLHFTLHDVFGEGDYVAVRWTMRGLHHATFAGIAPTQRAIVQDANVVYRCEGGRIAQLWMRADTLGLYQQLGVVDPALGNPAPSVLGDRLQQLIEART